MIAISSLFGLQLYLLLRDLHPEYQLERWLVLISVLFSMPIIAYSSQILPEMLAALLVTFALRFLASAQPTTRHLLAVGLMAAVLPWLHLRYTLFTGAILATAICCYYRKVFVSRLLLLIYPALASAVLYCIVSLNLYGTLLPTGAYAPIADSKQLYTTDSIYMFSIGSLLSPDYGLLPWAPIYLLSLAGISVAVRRFKITIIWTCAFLLYLVQIGWIFGFGWGIPPRYLVVWIPLLAVVLYFVVISSKVFRTIFVPLSIISLAIAAAAVTHFPDLYSDAITGRPRAPIASTLQHIWPQYFAYTPGFSLRSSDAPHVIGQVSEDHGGVLRADPTIDKPGVLMYGPYKSLSPGDYTATYTIAGLPSNVDEPVAIVSIAEWPVIEVAKRAIYGHELHGLEDLVEVSLDFHSNGLRQAQSIVFWTGNGELLVHEATVRNNTNPLDPKWVIPSALMTLSWIVILMTLSVVIYATSIADIAPHSATYQHDRGGTGCGMQPARHSY